MVEMIYFIFFLHVIQPIRADLSSLETYRITFKSCQQSSDFFSAGVCSKAYDGNTNPTLSARGCLHTMMDNPAWWRGQLTETVWLKEVKLYNRDVMQHSLNKFVINTAFGRCLTYDSSNFLQKTFPCEGVTNFLEIRKTVADYLMMCEAEGLAYRIPAVTGVIWTSTTDSVTLSWSASPAPDVTYEVRCSASFTAKTKSTTQTCSSLSSGSDHQISIIVSKVLSDTDVVRSSAMTTNTKTKVSPASSIMILSHERSLEVSWTASTTPGAKYKLQCGSFILENLTTPQGICTGLSSATDYNISVTASKDGFSDSTTQTANGKTKIPSITSTQITWLSEYNKIQVSWQKSITNEVVYLLNCGTGETINTTKTTANCTTLIESGSKYNISLSVRKGSFRSSETTFEAFTKIVPVSPSSFNFSSNATTISLSWSESSTKNVQYTLMCPTSNITGLTITHASCHDLSPNRTYSMAVIVTKPGFPDTVTKNITYETQLRPVSASSFRFEVTEASITVSWNASALSGVQYQLQCGTSTQTVSSPKGTCTGLAEATIYTISVSVKSPKHPESQAAAAVYATKSRVEPAEMTAKSITLKWKPIITSEFSVTYEIVSQSDSARVRRSTTSKTVVNDSEVKFTDLLPYTKYRFTGTSVLYAYGRAFRFPLFESSLLTNQSAASPCRNFQCFEQMGRFNSLHCSWQKPLNPNGLLIGYRIFNADKRELWQSADNNTYNAYVTSADSIKPDVNITLILMATGEKFLGQEAALTNFQIQPGRPYVRASNARDILEKFITTRPSKDGSQDQFQVKVSFNDIFSDRHGRIVRKYLLVGRLELKDETQVKYAEFKLSDMSALMSWISTDRVKGRIFVINVEGLEESEDGYLTVGTDKTCNVDCNGPLVEDKNYFVAAIACTRISCLSVGFLTHLSSSSSSLLIPLLAGACGTGGVLIIVIILLIVVIIRNKITKDKKEDEPEKQKREEASSSVNKQPRCEDELKETTSRTLAEKARRGSAYVYDETTVSNANLPANAADGKEGTEYERIPGQEDMDASNEYEYEDSSMQQKTSGRDEEIQEKRENEQIEMNSKEEKGTNILIETYSDVRIKTLLPENNVQDYMQADVIGQHT